MAVKRITSDVEAYQRLKKRKRENESFSELIKRVLPAPFDYDAWFKRLEENPVSEQFVQAVEEQITQRVSPLNTKDFHGASGHKRADRSAAKSAQRRTPARGGRRKAASWERPIAANIADLGGRIMGGRLPFGRCARRGVENHELLRGVELLELTGISATQFGRVKARLLPIGRPAGVMDILIAAMAMENGETILTGNPSHFIAIPGLEVETY
jgi:predicted CopG family antitoxin